MGDDTEQVDIIDEQVAAHYHAMMLFLKDEHRDVKIKDHKYTLRATIGGRVRGTFGEVSHLEWVSTAPLNSDIAGMIRFEASTDEHCDALGCYQIVLTL